MLTWKKLQNLKDRILYFLPFDDSCSITCRPVPKFHRQFWVQGLFQLIPDQLRMAWSGAIGKPLRVIFWSKVGRAYGWWRRWGPFRAFQLHEIYPLLPSGLCFRTIISRERNYVKRYSPLSIRSVWAPCYNASRRHTSVSTKKAHCKTWEQPGWVPGFTSSWGLAPVPKNTLLHGQLKRAW